MLRETKEWTQEDLADKTGFHRTYIGMIERGEKNITLESIAKIAKALDVSIPQLLKKMAIRVTNARRK